MNREEDFYNYNYAQVSLEEALSLNKYLNDNKTKWTAKELLERTKFCQAWNSSVCVAEVAAKTNTSSPKVKRLAKEYQADGFKLIKFDPNAKYERQTYMPTPEEIRKACEKIRATWSPAVERYKRRCDWRKKPVEFSEMNPSLNRKLPSTKGNE